MIYIILKVTVCVRLKITEKNSILIVIKSIRERCGKIVPSIGVRVTSDIILEVTNISAVPTPPNLLIFCLFFTIDGNFHSVVEHGIAFVMIHYVEFNTVAFSSILNSEIKPLGVAFSIDIVLHKTIVLYVGNFLSQK